MYIISPEGVDCCWLIWCVVWHCLTNHICTNCIHIILFIPTLILNATTLSVVREDWWDPIGVDCCWGLRFHCWRNIKQVLDTKKVFIMLDYRRGEINVWYLCVLDHCIQWCPSRGWLLFVGCVHCMTYNVQLIGWHACIRKSFFLYLNCFHANAATHCIFSVSRTRTLMRPHRGWLLLGLEVSLFMKHQAGSRYQEGLYHA